MFLFYKGEKLKILSRMNGLSSRDIDAFQLSRLYRNSINIITFQIRHSWQAKFDTESIIIKWL